jgi:hypothetical protein
MGGGGDHMAVGQGIGVTACCDETGDVGNVRHQVRTHLIGDRPEFFKGGLPEDRRSSRR